MVLFAIPIIAWANFYHLDFVIVLRNNPLLITSRTPFTTSRQFKHFVIIRLHKHTMIVFRPTPHVALGIIEGAWENGALRRAAFCVHVMLKSYKLKAFKRHPCDNEMVGEDVFNVLAVIYDLCPRCGGVHINDTSLMGKAPESLEETSITVFLDVSGNVVKHDEVECLSKTRVNSNVAFHKLDIPLEMLFSKIYPACNKLNTGKVASGKQ